MRVIASLTFSESIRNRWILYFTICFASLSFLLAIAGSNETQTFSNFDRNAATFLNILMLFIPLLGFSLGAQSIAGDREGGALVYLLSNPITKFQLFCGKWLGCVLSLLTAILGGLGFAAVGLAVKGASGFRSFAILALCSILFSIVCVSIGMLISVFSQNRSRSIGTSIMTWLTFTIFSDLVIMGTAYVLRLRSEGIVALALLNPIEIFKILTVRLLATNLEVLGAGGMYLDFFFGKYLVLFLVGWLVFISLAAWLASCWLFLQQEEY